MFLDYYFLYVNNILRSGRVYFDQNKFLVCRPKTVKYGIHHGIHNLGAQIQGKHLILFSRRMGRGGHSYCHGRVGKIHVYALQGTIK